LYAFARLREVLAAHKELASKLEKLEGRLENHDEEIRVLFAAIRRLMNPPQPARRRIGFRRAGEE
jgi:hypothetical protein